MKFSAKAFLESDPKVQQIVRDSGSSDPKIASAALYELAKALELPLRKGVMSGDILDNIFEQIKLDSNSTNEFPLDFLSPGTEKEFIAYTMPNAGYIPQRNVEGDYVMVPTYTVGDGIDWKYKFARDARWDVPGRAMEVLRKGFTKKLNDDGWSVLLSAAADRNILVFDSDAAAGQFTKRLLSLMKVVMRRNGGGNSSSVNRRKLTDLFLSPEGMEDIRNWNVDQIDEVTRREIYVSSDDGVSVNRIFGVNLHDLDELGVGQEYQLFWTADLAGSMGASDEEIVIGLDLSESGSFIMPVREELQIYTDDTMHRQGRSGLYGRMEVGFAQLDSRFSIAGSF